MERPLERRAAARTAVVWDAVTEWLASRADEVGPPGATVVDVGGGTGGFAVRVAELGHRVTVIDPSPDALAALDRRAREHGVADRITGQQGDLAGLSGLVDPTSVDLVLCHEVLGIVADPAVALAGIDRVLRPGGALSLVVSQRHAAVLARAMAGHFAEAKEMLLGHQGGRGEIPRPVQERRFTAEELTGLLGEAGFNQVQIHAIRVFADLVPAALLELEPGALDGLLELERAVADRPEYLTLATQLHCLASR